MNVCMVGHGMMGVWHSEALAAAGAVPHTLVGRRPESTAAFAERHGYRRWTTDLAEALADPAVEAVIVASPSEQHVDQALACIAAGKPALVEIPLAMSLAAAERVVEAAARAGVMLALCHPMRFQPERAPLLARLRGGEERIRHIGCRFFIQRLENVGATGYRRSWTDNILWHHFCHFVDLALWLLDEADPPRVEGYLGQPHPLTGVPMECSVLIEAAGDRTCVVHGSYHASFRLYDSLTVTDQDTYLLDLVEARQRTATGTVPVEAEQAVCARVTHDFVAAVRESRPPHVPASSALPALRVLQRVQDAWDARHGAQALPGRKLA